MDFYLLPPIYETSELWKEYLQIPVLDLAFFPELPVGKEVPYDPRISYTISYFLKRFFKKYQDTVLTFVCDSRDGKESARFKLFDRWFELNGSKVFYKESFQHKGEYNFYAGMIIRNDHPDKEIAIQAFKLVMGLYLLSD